MNTQTVASFPEIQEGLTVYVVDPSYIWCPIQPWTLKKNDKYESGYCLKTTIEHLSYYTLAWPVTWEKHVGSLYFFSKEEAEQHLEQQINKWKSMLQTKEGLIQSLFTGWQGEETHPEVVKEAKRRILEEFGVVVE
ncbi:hypothetical protein ACFYKX_10700 [Cytobacillus sp. FJAT-54145]|uniref:Uncharacterized protein n=1 Tax=Cytobacillus spartinae TaxID=3299023 RepID=A0ABW6KE38_9BACI